MTKARNINILDKMAIRVGQDIVSHVAKNFKLKDFVVEFLEKNPNQKFTAREIAIWILKSYPKECKHKQSRSQARANPLDSDDALTQQIVAEIGSSRPRIEKTGHIKTTESRPRRYYYTEQTEVSEVQNAESRLKTKESDLYHVLREFLSSELSVHSMRIDEKRASNMRGINGNKWLYPDIVGIQDLSAKWSREIKDCVQQYSDKKTKLWSFEVKVLINKSNVREAFFQAVSNSSWANFAYLVAGELEGAITSEELRILCGLHGVGFILLDAEDPTESQIRIPAKERYEIDWHTANRIADENTDFLKYIKLIKQFYQTGEIDPKKWI